MHALVYDGRLNLVSRHPVPGVPEKWARIRVRLAGICNTDLEISKGYMDFKGVLGHEFVGVVDACSEETWVGKRVVGEINAACGQCDMCDRGLGRHCPNRSTLGIQGLDGCMADYCVLPISNLREVPEDIPDERVVFTEPLSAACEIIEQLKPARCKRAIVLGDGKLGILCAWVLCTILSDVTLVGHHASKLKAARWKNLKTARNLKEVESWANIVVEATGTAEGIKHAMEICEPRGHIVLKSTIASDITLNLAPLVVNEQTIVGSRCGQFRDGMRMLEKYPDMPIERLITARYPLAEAEKAFEHAAEPQALKVLIETEL